jgi:Holliday junction resolvasome RuvABC endonuclease subunit
MAGGCMAFDLASSCGFAYGRFPQRPLTPLEMATIKPKQPLSGVVKFSGEVGPFLADFDRWLNQIMDEHRPAGVAFESPILPTITTPQTVMKLMGMAGVLLMTCHKRRIRWVRQAQPATVKKFISGHGGKGKERVMAAIRSFGWGFSSDDEADSLALFCFAADLYAAERAKARSA